MIINTNTGALRAQNGSRLANPSGALADFGGIKVTAVLAVIQPGQSLPGEIFDAAFSLPHASLGGSLVADPTTSRA